jgi:RecA-family ATPase
VEVIEGVAWTGCLSVLVAEAAAGKTFLFLDMGACLADGAVWHRRRVTPGSVAYLSFEANALSLRLDALRERAGRTLQHLHLLDARDPLSPRLGRDGTETPSLGEASAARALASLAARLAAASEPPIVCLMIDTIAASMVGSENTTEIVSAYLWAVRRLA